MISVTLYLDKYYIDHSLMVLSRLHEASNLASGENTVKTRMFYARKRLSELLKAAGIDRGWP